MQQHVGSHRVECFTDWAGHHFPVYALTLEALTNEGLRVVLDTDLGKRILQCLLRGFHATMAHRPCVSDDQEAQL